MEFVKKVGKNDKKKRPKRAFFLEREGMITAKKREKRAKIVAKA